MKYICMKCWYSQENYPPTVCPECGAPQNFFLSQKAYDEYYEKNLLRKIDNPSEETKQKLAENHYKVASGVENCSNCCHMEIMEVGTRLERCNCRLMWYFFSNTERNKAHICDMYMEGTTKEGLISELASLIINSQTSREEDTDNNSAYQSESESTDYYEENAIREPQEKKSEGCYIATAVYGSYDCPQVWTLRRYRDNTLKKSVFGRAFVKAYYSISPALVKRFGHIIWLKRVIKKLLDCFVKRLKENGVQDYPYED